MAKKLYSFRLDQDLVEKKLKKHATKDNNGRKLVTTTERLEHVLTSFVQAAEITVTVIK